MGFIFTKTLLYLILPPASVIILMTAGFLMLRTRRALGQFMIGTGFLLLYLLSIGPVSETLLLPLESLRSPPQ